MFQRVFVKQGVTILVFPEHIGGGPASEMSLAPGGLIKQILSKDNISAEEWDIDSAIILNVQLINALSSRPSRVWVHRKLPYLLPPTPSMANHFMISMRSLVTSLVVFGLLRVWPEWTKRRKRTWTHIWQREILILSLLYSQVQIAHLYRLGKWSRGYRRFESRTVFDCFFLVTIFISLEIRSNRVLQFEMQILCY